MWYRSGLSEVGLYVSPPELHLSGELRLSQDFILDSGQYAECAPLEESKVKFITRF